MSSRTEVFTIPDHTLLRVIGRGSYGEVWLARNVMGTLRAVKIVRRAAFDSDRPYLREFEGIRRCEPVSRAHDGLIDILHMGRNDDAGWFYYVMELADGTDPTDPTDPTDYHPATLAARIGEGKALEVTECLRIAESLAGALAFLHEQGLIHRDVKPSNILYAGGVPKLGDIGLVAEAGSSRSFVGTEGFVPLEGPGTERADIFALGKVLYEALTGMDRSKFPRLPADWTQAYDFEQRLELNEIVLRACEGDTVRRYHSAREMLADVALIASGRSVRKMRGMERRMRALKWIAGSVAVLALAALGISGVWRQQAERERALRLRAGNAERAALLDQVHAARHDPSTGAVLRGLSVAREAAALGVTDQLRDDAIFLLSRSDFALRPDLAFPDPTERRWIADDADRGLRATMPVWKEDSPGPLTITMHSAGAPEKVCSFTVPNAPPRMAVLQFSRGGGRLLVTGQYGAGLVLDTATGAMLHPEPFPPSYDFGTPLAFCGDKGEAVIRRSNDGGFAIYTLPGGERRKIPPLEGWPLRDQDDQPQRLWPSPDGKFVLLIDDELQLPAQSGIFASLLKPAASATRGAACLVEVATGRILWKVSGPDEQVAAWSADGTRIAVRHSDYIVSLNALTGKPTGTVPQRIRNRGTQLAFFDSRDMLIFSTWSMTGLCDVGREQMLGRPPVVERWNYSHARRLLSGGSGMAEWKRSPVLRILSPPRIANRAVFISFSPKEDWLISGQGSFAGWRLDKANCEPEFMLPATGAAGVLFSPDEKSAQFLTDGGRHPMAWTGEPPESLPDPLPYGPVANRHPGYASASRDGTVLAFGGQYFVIVRREGEEARTFPTSDGGNPVALSPDGRWLAVGAFHVQDVRVFDLHRSDAEPVHVEPSGYGSYPCFSPDGKWLACSGFHENRILNTGTWTLEHRFPRSSSSLVGHISFSADTRLMSIMETMTRVAIIEPGTWRTLYHFDSPLDEIFERNGLSPSGRYFAAVGTRREIYLWDLHALAAELQKLGLE